MFNSWTTLTWVSAWKERAKNICQCLSKFLPKSTLNPRSDSDSNEEKRRMFLVDHVLGCTYRVQVVTARSLRAGLREGVAVRHDWECVSTRLEVCAPWPTSRAIRCATLIPNLFLLTMANGGSIFWLILTLQSIAHGRRRYTRLSTTSETASRYYPVNVILPYNFKEGPSKSSSNFDDWWSKFDSPWQSLDSHNTASMAWQLECHWQLISDSILSRCKYLNIYPCLNRPLADSRHWLDLVLTLSVQLEPARRKTQKHLG